MFDDTICERTHGATGAPCSPRASASELFYVRYVPAGKEFRGNCATFAETAAVLATMAGHQGDVVPSGRAHVVAVADGWVFDAWSYEPYRAAR